MASFGINNITYNGFTVTLSNATGYTYWRLFVYDVTNDHVDLDDQYATVSSYPYSVSALPQTTYRVNVGYTNVPGGGVTWLGATTFVTPAAPGWKNSTPYVFANGAWRPATLYVFVNGAWRQSSPYVFKE